MTQTQSNNFTMSINSTIEADDSVHAVIDPFDGVMYLEDWAPQTPFVRLNFPQTTSATRSAVNITQFTDILDLDAFTVFNTWVLLNETLRVSVEGDTHVTVSGISRKFPVHFKKTLTLTGLSNFDGTTVPNSTVSLTADAQGDNFFGTVIIPNRSPITFEIVSGPQPAACLPCLNRTSSVRATSPPGLLTCPDHPAGQRFLHQLPSRRQRRHHFH